MRILPVFFIFLLSLPACSKKNVNLPLPAEKLVAVLMDLHLAEAAYQNLSTSAKDTLAFQYYDQVYQMHNVSKIQVDSAISLLNRHPDIFAEIYAQVKDGLEESAAAHLQEMQNNTKTDKKARN